MRERYRELSFYSHRLQVRVEGFRLERLLEKGMKAGLNIKGVHLYSETEMVCTVSKEDFKALKKLGRSLYKFTVISERGPVVSLWSFLRKPALIIGCLLTCAFVVIESLVVQSIEVNGYKAIPEVELLQVLEEEGIYKGAFRPEINWEKAEKAIYDVFPQVTWVQLAYSGRLVVLNISETDHDIYEKGVQNYPQEQEGGLQDTEDLMYTDIVATRSGYIESIAPYYGLAMVEK
ncbi:MAG: hypothetical protein HFE73_00395, partial [Firmicutes bacterium]|nr:hypothetical protein [Bacillota bacterium]